jgi:hypothetical protein
MFGSSKKALKEREVKRVKLFPAFGKNATYGCDLRKS